MENFWDSSVWGIVNLVTILLLSLLVANLLKKTVKILQRSLIPTSVLGGLLLLVIAGVYRTITGRLLFDEPFFGGKGMATMEIITYHMLALGFIASTLRSSEARLTKKRTEEIFNTGVTTVATYLLQAVVGLGITMIAALVMKDFFVAAGVLLPFGYGQGTGQAMNYGAIYENDFGFVGGKSFGLTIAALGFLSASVGGVIHLNILKRQRKIESHQLGEKKLYEHQIQMEDEIPMNGSMDKLTVQIAIICGSYLIAYVLMYVLGRILPGMRSVIYGFNFLLGVMGASLVKLTLRILKNAGIVKKRYINDFLMNRVSNACFDLMVVSGIAAIRLDVLADYWVIILVLGVAGLVITYFYNLLVAKTLFKEYSEEQFLAMYGMLTGTASTGVILLREVDEDFKTPVADNLVYQNFPAIVFGFPLMLLATLAPKQPALTMVVLIAFFAVMNVILFRSLIFKKKNS